MLSSTPPRAALALAGLVFTSSERSALSAEEPASEAAPVPPGGGAAEARFAEPPKLEIIPPRAHSDTSVEYPDGAVGDAVVELELSISANGAVTSARVIAGDSPFAEAAQAAAERWQFEPALRAGLPVPSRIRFRVGFEQRLEAPDTAVPGGPVPGGASPGAPPAGDGVAAAQARAASPAASPPEPLAVTVMGDRSPGARRISRAFARELPGAFSNPFAAIEASPGVTPTLSGAPYFYVRGAPPGNLGYFIDDIRLPALFHVLAGPSVVHPAMVESLDFHPGPYPARYGRFTGGIAAGQVRRASYELHGEVSVRAFDSSGLLEVPLGKTPASTSLTLAGRVAYANPIAHLFAPEISVSYWDYQARLSHQLGRRDELVALAFGSRDALDRTEDDGERERIFGAEFHRLQLRYLHALDAGSLRLMAVGGWDRSDQADGDVELTNTTGRLRADLVHELGPRTRFDAGLDVGLDRYGITLAALENEEDRLDFLERYPTRTDSVAGGYVGVRVRWTPSLRVELGTRVDVFGSRDSVEAAVSPSVFAEFDIGPSLTLIHALGVAHQPPSSNVPEPGANQCSAAACNMRCRAARASA
jgi:TonB family protein